MPGHTADRRWDGDPQQTLDCVVVGGGPAGLTAAIYLSRFLRSCVVIDAGSGRAASIPRSHNLPGYPDGLSGIELLSRLEAQLHHYRGIVRRFEVDAIALSEAGFVVSYGAEVLRSRAVIFATGVVNHRPDMPEAMHAIAVTRGLIRYCPICDGYEARQTPVAVLGADHHGAAEALFLRNYGAEVTLLAQRSLDLTTSDLERLVQAGVNVVHDPIDGLRIADDAIEVSWRDARKERFGTLYPALGSTPRTRMATALGASTSAQDCLLTDEHQQTSIPGLYAIGDVVEGLDQICVATGQAATAATAIHNELLEHDYRAMPSSAADFQGESGNTLNHRQATRVKS